MIQIRQAVYEDIPRIMQFIDEHWKKGHIMGNNRKMFEFQHVRGKEVFYILAEDDKDGKIYGSVGYIPMSMEEYPAISQTMILSVRNPERRMLGEEMSRFVEQNIKCSNVVSAGVREKYAKAIMELSENSIGCMEHYYILNPLMEYKIAYINHYEERVIKKRGTMLVKFSSMGELKKHVNREMIWENNPFRDFVYIEHRYFKHPYYQYCVWGLERNGEVKSILVAREEQVQGRKVLRIVDFFGCDEDIAYAGNELLRLLKEEKYEYLDFYCYGIKPKYLLDAGFNLRTKDDTNIIPNYFHPFEKKNVELYFYTWVMEGVHVYRGLGDQDRPNFI